MRNIDYSNRRSPNLVAQVAGLIVGIGLFVLAIVIGGFLLAALLGLGLIAWLVISARIWWLTRKAERQPDADGHIVEAEYRVVEITDRDDPTQKRQP